MERNKHHVITLFLCIFMMIPTGLQAFLPVSNLFGIRDNGPIVEAELPLIATIAGTAVTGVVGMCALYKALRWVTYNKETESDKRNEARDDTFGLMTAAIVPGTITSLYYTLWKNTIKWAPMREVSVMAQRGTLYKQ